MDEQNRNLILATALSFLVILVWTLLFAPEPRPVDPNAGAPGTTQSNTASAPPGAEGAVPGALGADGIADRETVLARTERVTIETPKLEGSLSLTGGRIDDLKLKGYRETLDEDAELVTMLSPAGAEAAYYALYGWAAAEGVAPDAVPGTSTEWQVEGNATLAPGAPVTLAWDNGAGQVFRRTVAVDEDYLFTVTQSVENNSESAIRVTPYGVIARHGEPEQVGFYILHEGVIQAFDGEIAETDYDDMTDFAIDPRERAGVEKTAVAESGWIGFTDKYWMTTLVPEAGQPFTAAAKYTAGTDTYQTDMRLPPMVVEAGATAEVTTRLFAGAKEWEAIKAYERDFDIDRFDDSIDWGWFYFLTKPIFILLHWLNIAIGNMGWAIIALTLIIKAILFPLAYKSYVSMAKMKDLQPEMEKIKERVGEDKQKLQQEMMALYKKEKVNPAAGCLPILAQIPIFFSLYKVIFVTLELRHAPFFGWIQDLSAPDPTSWMNLFGALPYEIPGFLGLLSIGVWPILMGVTMWLQQKLNPAPPDPTQAAIFAWMPWVFMFMLGTFASGLVIYWVANNTITFIQQYAIMRSQGMKPDVLGNILKPFRKQQDADTS